MLQIRSPYSHEVVGTVEESGREDLDRAVQAAAAAFEHTRKLPAFRRSAILFHMRDRLAAEQDSYARLITGETGKPIKESRAEVGRALLTLATSAEEAKRITGESIPLDIAEPGASRLGIMRRFPIGPIGAITPFNYPLNLVLHKVGPGDRGGKHHCRQAIAAYSAYRHGPERISRRFGAARRRVVGGPGWRSDRRGHG